MLSLVKKELLQLFGSLIAYLTLVVFSLLTSLFLWFFDGNMNILGGGYASMSSFFDLAPWLFLFLIPSVTMRLFSEEIRSGTMELLLTRPITSLQLILSKLVASFVVVFLAVLLSLVTFFSVYFLGHPAGVMDVAGTMGSYLGLLMLSLVFVAAGIFASSLTENQVVAFLVAVFLSFFLFSGFELMADLVPTGMFSSLLNSLGISSHYESVSRGVADSRDIVYFLAVALVLVFLTMITLRKGRQTPATRSGRSVILLAGFVLLILLTQVRIFRIDFTAEKRYTLSDSSVRLLGKVSQPLLAELYLEGDMPPGIKRLKAEVEDLILDIHQYAGNTVYVRKVDPYKEVPAKDRNAYFNELIRKGIVPTDLRITTDQGVVTRRVFPTLVLHYEGKSAVINLLKNDPALRAEENLNRSVEMLEYETMNAVHNLLREKPLNLAFLEGHQESDSLQVLDFAGSLQPAFKVSRLNCTALARNIDSTQVVVIAGPRERFTESDKYVLDQYLMRGGRMVWLIDPVRVSLDSLSEGMTTLAMPVDLNLTDQLFHYGARLNNDLLQDAECVKIRVNTAPAGTQPSYSLAPWYFSPLLQPSQHHPVGRNVSPVASEFVSSLDTVGENGRIRKTVLLATSSFSRRNETPMMVNLRMIDVVPSANFFNKSGIMTGLLLEGSFSSVFGNRIVDSRTNPTGLPFIAEGKPAQLAVFSDGGLLNNKVTRSSGEPRISPLGYDRVMKITFGNRDFFMNLVQYMCDDASLAGLRNKNLQLRTLDRALVSGHKELIRWINLVVPLVLVLLIGLVFNWRRKRAGEMKVVPGRK